jgi:hypothetical protein
LELYFGGLTCITENEEENNGYVVFKRNTHRKWGSGQQGFRADTVFKDDVNGFPSISDICCMPA